MKTSIRNRLAGLLLESFDDVEKRAAVGWLSMFCEMAVRRERPEVWLSDLRRERPRTSLRSSSRVECALGHLMAPKLIQLRCPDTGDVLLDSGVEALREAVWLVEPPPDVRAAFPEVCDRARTYARLVAGLGSRAVASSSRDPLRKAMTEAAMCFNAGLFFEAHEHLEHHWATQPKGPTRRFLQGIIQVSVGFHHARAGKYDGAVNLLGKGLDKTSGTSGEFLGLYCDAFLPKVAAVRAVVVRRGRTSMRPLPLSRIPRMPIRKI